MAGLASPSSTKGRSSSRAIDLPGRWARAAAGGRRGTRRPRPSSARRRPARSGRPPPVVRSRRREAARRRRRAGAVGIAEQGHRGPCMNGRHRPSTGAHDGARWRRADPGGEGRSAPTTGRGRGDPAATAARDRDAVIPVPEGSVRRRAVVRRRPPPGRGRREGRFRVDRARLVAAQAQAGPRRGAPSGERHTRPKAASRANRPVGEALGAARLLWPGPGRVVGQAPRHGGDQLGAGACASAPAAEIPVSVSMSAGAPLTRWSTRSSAIWWTVVPLGQEGVVGAAGGGSTAKAGRRPAPRARSRRRPRWRTHARVRHLWPGSRASSSVHLVEMEHRSSSSLEPGAAGWPGTGRRRRGGRRRRCGLSARAATPPRRGRVDAGSVRSRQRQEALERGESAVSRALASRLRSPRPLAARHLDGAPRPQHQQGKRRRRPGCCGVSGMNAVMAATARDRSPTVVTGWLTSSAGDDACQQLVAAGVEGAAAPRRRKVGRVGRARPGAGPGGRSRRRHRRAGPSRRFRRNHRTSPVPAAVTRVKASGESGVEQSGRRSRCWMASALLGVELDGELGGGASRFACPDGTSPGVEAPDRPGSGRFARTAHHGGRPGSAGGRASARPQHRSVRW